MKLASFFAISAALHALALFCSASFLPYAHESLIPVALIKLDEPLGTSDKAESVTTPKTSKAGTDRGGMSELASLSDRALAHAAQGHEHAAVSAQRSILESSVAKSHEPEKFSPPAENAVGMAAGAVGFASPISSDGEGLAGTALGGGQSRGPASGGQYGSGSGTGNGDGSSPRAARFTRARYRETPKPFYPESARREGQEGRVLLRVLVDQEGKSKTVEISGSSGSETLDHAAAETIKRWRFSPARYGDKPVESWVRIPIDFHLTDTKD